MTDDPAPIPVARVHLAAGVLQVEVEAPLSLSEVSRVALRLFRSIDAPGADRAVGGVGFLYTERAEPYAEPEFPGG